MGKHAYAYIIHLEGYQSEKFFKILHEQGKEKALEYMATWDCSKDSEYNLSLKSEADKFPKVLDVFKKDNYVLCYLESLKFVILERKINLEEWRKLINIQN